MGQDFSRAESELIGFYLSNFGIAGQSYDHGGGGGDETESAFSHQCAQSRQHRRVEQTLAELGPGERHALWLVYHPHRYSDLLRATFVRAQGSFEMLAAHTQAAKDAATAAKRNADPASVLVWLDEQMRKGEHAPKQLIRAISTECERTLRMALIAYDTARRTRIEREKAEERAARSSAWAEYESRVRAKKLERAEALEHEKRVSDIADLLRPLVSSIPPSAA